MFFFLMFNMLHLEKDKASIRGHPKSTYELKTLNFDFLSFSYVRVRFQVTPHSRGSTHFNH